MHDDATRMQHRTGWSGSRRTLLSAAAGLWLPRVLPAERVATPVPQPATAGLRDFAYVCAALMLEAQERDDLQALAGVRYEKSWLVLTPEAAVAANLYADPDARRIFAYDARQLYAYAAANPDESRG